MTTNLLRGRVMEVRLRVVEFGGVWRSLALACHRGLEPPNRNDRRLLQLVLKVLHTIEAGVFHPTPARPARTAGSGAAAGPGS